MSRLLVRATALTALTLGILSATDAIGSTANYSGTICKNYIDYQVWVAPGKNISTIEANLVHMGMTYEKLGLLPPTCLNPFMEYVCSSNFPRVAPSSAPNNYNVQFACKSTCQSAVAKCSPIFTFAGKQDWIPDCDGPINGTVQTMPPNGVLFQPDNSCNMRISPTVPGGQNSFKCPTPFFISDPMLGPNGTTTNPDSCRSGCCMPCPAQDLLYRPGVVERGHRIADGFRIISTVLSFILVITFVFSPRKRNSLVFSEIICVFLFSAMVVFPLVNRRGIQCVDEINFSTQQNNIKCAIQGTLIYFAIAAGCAWFVAIVLALHLHTVWNKDWISRNNLLTNVVCWGFGMAVSGNVLAKGEYRWESGSYCKVSYEKSSGLFFYPMAFILLPSYLIHICTLGHIARFTIKTGSDPSTASRLTINGGEAPSVSHYHQMLRILKIQWRAILQTSLGSAVIIYYWRFYNLQFKKTNRDVIWHSLQNHLISCLTNGGDQETCVDQLAPYVPSSVMVTLVEVLLANIGTIHFIVFFRVAMLREWREHFKKVGYFLFSSRLDTEEGIKTEEELKAEEGLKAEERLKTEEWEGNSNFEENFDLMNK